ncbi:MAG TPA: ABC transporter substrate-binding protein, partial [Trueperaceae bacterium]|nr:ABC transporter substrate-binding protein [Trueperaceae bacterium]
AAAKHALRYALPMMRKAATVHLVSIDEEGAPKSVPSAQQIADYLMEVHCVSVQASGLRAADSPPEQLAEFYAEVGADMLVMGAYSSGITNPLAQYFTRQQRPFLVFTSSDDAITRPGSDWIFRINQPSYAYAQVLFDVFDAINAERGAGTLKTIVTVHGNGAFESAVADAVDLIASERGYTVLQRQDYDQAGADFRPILNRFKTLNPDVLFMVSYAADSVALMRQVQEVGLDAKVFAGGAAGFALPGFIEGSGPAADYVFTATMWTKDVPYPGAQDLNARLSAILGRTPSYHAAQAYAAVITAVDVLKRAASFAPADVRAALLATNMPDTVYGPIRFEDYQGYKNQAPLPAVAEQVVNGDFVTVYVNGQVVGDLLETPSWNAR